ncbi:bifunctional folylpolyglutamate synthase/dihydrofolate synthase [Liquorilactobacillus uvarum]|uniref:bifunctional folylpolyglutamate synthase/dihydrofolate synthase n=1 Tax=Liquorilactobacillus uvarum TaxID=303240 RepID=UPI0028897C24|nr:folylpolyglutamate synthase/dihydrofolate synthase family protein [Liquorilactobacillus uvarum]
MSVKSYAEALNFIHGRTKFKKSPSLDRMRKFVTYLGHPEEKIKAVHVTGTNGKGSTTVFLRNLLMSQGLHVGTFTSPFMVKFNERITIDGQMIADNELVRLVNKIIPIVKRLDEELMNQEGGPTEFELVTALMFVYFAEQNVDIAVVEVGIGGTYDSTNVIMPLVSVITTVALDHANLLGNTLTSIARHKAGIIKPDRPTVIGRLNAEAKKVVTDIAAQKRSELYAPDEKYRVTSVSSSKRWGENFAYAGLGKHFAKLHESLLGRYQIDNAATALTAFLLIAQMQGWQVRTSEISTALAHTNWPGRFELINQEPMIVLDGAHNEAAIEEVKGTLLTHFKGQKIFVIIAILADKQPQTMIRKLAEIPNIQITVTTFNAPRKVAQVSSLVENIKQLDYEKQWQRALVKTLQQMSATDILLITGSLYFISEVRRYFTT